MVKKVLCICNQGNNRSGSMAKYIRSLNGSCLDTSEEYLRDFVKYDVISAGAHGNSLETLKLLIEWADLVIDMSDEAPRIQRKLQFESGSKYRRCDVGDDIWGNNSSPELLLKCESWFQDNVIL